MSLGLCVNPDYIPSPTELIELNPAFLRSIVYTDRDVHRLIATGYPLHLTINNEWDRVGWDWSGWESACFFLASVAGREQIRLVHCGNELDVYWAIREDDVPPIFGARLVGQALRLLGPVGIAVATTTLGGPRWPEYLDQLLRLSEPDVVAFNPYGWIWDGLGTKLNSLRTITELPIDLAELGCKIRDAGGEDAVGDAVHGVVSDLEGWDATASWFAYHDLIGKPDERGPNAFGLLAEDGRRRPAYDAFVAVNAASLPEPAPPISTPPEPLPVIPTRDDVIAISNAVADEKLIPRRLLLGCGVAESDLDPEARRPSDPKLDRAYWPDVSSNVWQQTIRFDPDYRGGDEFPGQFEVARVIRIQADIWRSARVAADQLKRHLEDEIASQGLVQGPWPDRVLLRAMHRYNWPNGKGEPYSDEHRRNYERGLAEASLILGSVPVVEEPPAHGWFAEFDRDAPMFPQGTSWSCSAAAMAWVARSLGREMSEQQAIALLGPAINPEVGLRLGSGAELAGTLRGIGYTVDQRASATFDDIVGASFHGPVAIGGRRWGGVGHWVGVRGYDPEDDALEIANSSLGFDRVFGVLTRSDFTRVGPFSMVAVEAPRGDWEDPLVIEEQQQRIKQLEGERDALINTIGYLTGDVADALEKANTVIEQFRTEVAAVIDTLRRHAA